MARVSPTVEGFRAAFRRPSLTFAEIAWRWALGATAWALLLFWFFEFLNTLPVTKGDAAMLSTRQPALVGRAISHILQGSLNRGVLAAVLAGLALSLLWILAAALGRAATVRALVEYFREKWADHVLLSGNDDDGRGEVAGNVSAEARSMIGPHSLRALIALNFLRVALVLAGILALVGAAILASFASSDIRPKAGLALVLFLPLAALIGTVWSGLSWLLSLAGIFCVRDGEDALGAAASATAFCRERTGAVFAVSTWTGLAHFVAFSAATTAVSLPLGLLPVVPWRVAFVGAVLVTLVYFAVVDWLYMARLAGYLCIAEMPEAIASSEPQPSTPSPGDQFEPGPAVQTTIDRDEPILSDVQSPMFSV